jgi:PAS domain S-box-containing protein
MKPDDNLPLMAWRARPDMSCEYVNQAWLEFTGYTLEQALGHGWPRGVHPEDLARWLDACVRAFDERKPFALEYRLRRRDGEYRWVRDQAAPRFTREGVFVGYGGACVDIEEQKREQHSLARALEAIERSARTQSRVIANLLELANAAGDQHTAWTGEGPLLAGVRVLVVDRECQDLVRLLEVAGADVRGAPDTRDAVQAIGAWRPDVVLSDSEGCLRAAALTADGSAAAAAGCDAQLAKPVEPVALLATVARLAA